MHVDVKGNIRVKGTVNETNRVVAIGRNAPTTKGTLDAKDHQSEKVETKVVDIDTGKDMNNHFIERSRFGGGVWCLTDKLRFLEFFPMVHLQARS
jgi:hypothetical protein